MSALVNIGIAVIQRLMLWAEGIVALFRVLVGGIAALIRGGKADVGRFFLDPATQRRALAVLRAFWPNLSLKRQLMRAYDNTGTAIVTRRADVLDVLSRNGDFEVVYGARMRQLTEGDNFFLGMQPGWEYTCDTSAMRLAARMSDVAEIVQPRAATRAQEIVAASGGTLDIVPALTLDIPWDMTATYFGCGGEREAMQRWTTTLFWYLFQDLGADRHKGAHALGVAAELRDYLDETIAARKAAPTETPDILNRCLALQAAGTPGMSDLGIRNNLLGLLIGAIPTISKASCLALDELLNRPDALASAQRAAQADDDDLLARHIWEALRFNPFNPVIYRRATRETILAPSTLRRMRVRKGQMVFAANFSACFDRLDIPDPNAFRTDRPWETYILWGYGMHTCFGDTINRAVIPAILKPLLARKNLRRAPGEAGQIAPGPFGFPAHFHLTFDP